ncbi:BREX-1 system phosphatase PglZ type A [Cylindrospermopsis raciborskii]|uniref:TIGR02687 family protein n=1 Tax=Cylindrospermopsis raciborskii CENA302 TaxID=1170768 RepID=A0A9Q5W938_9CYAN|nr:BREX-1 system phosphatase PglZ type A [Cylindrospermopsis raciborskii]NLQ06401.1 BREX-1 system phosphatase PglZ type A [Cylindrospermopsis raciborskii MVCC19]OHY35380.1 TIGR02687 family protein [Cylindrospermopsis raciborskii MVCC14]OPH09599.1 TIGR02687 family protein [Cylindrospermopsis raciborskii CENA302]
MNDRITQSLTKLFEKHRIVFWYDAKQELRQEFEAIALDGIEKIELKNNEFGVKYRILRQQPRGKFLLYHEGPQPADLDNWLLDTQLAHTDFRADQFAMWLAELELGREFTDVVQSHIAFFQAVERRKALKRLITSHDTTSQLRLKMVAVCAGCGSEARLEAILEQLLGELSGDSVQYMEGYAGDRYRLIERCELKQYFWEQMKRHYGYSSPEPSIKDFVLQLFADCYFKNFTAARKQRTETLSPDALVFLKRWKDSIKCKESFETLSQQCAEDLDIKRDLEERDIRDLIELDYFRLVDQKILSDLVRCVERKTVSSGDVAQWIWQRKQSHWYPEFEHLYEAVATAAQFIHELDGAYLTMDSLAEGIQRYASSWFRIDQFYRKFIYHVRRSGESSLMERLVDLIENLYDNNYLLKLNDRWQLLVDKAKSWSAPSIYLQNKFFDQWVQPRTEKKIFVIISDALRYEIGDELMSLIRKEDRYEATIELAMAMLPSYTQLGMAALLPHNTLALAEDSSGQVQVDSQSSVGLENRKKQLDRGQSKRATALMAEELMNLNHEDRRSLVRDHDVVYVYHNRIDATGDKRESEPRVFEAVEEALDELVKLIKKLTGANANNILVTADHGFIYQNRVIQESDFASDEPRGEQILFRDRRFVCGKGLKETPGLRKFTSNELGLSGEVEVQIPKSINRLRLKGSGSRYVHGGASLQEVVIPIIKINKKRTSDITSVEVEILPGASSIITAAQLTVVFYQAQASTDKVQPRTLQAGIYTQKSELISDSHDITFDLGSENSRDREVPVTFVLMRKADEVNGQEVHLRLNEKLSGTSQYKKYKSIAYTMRRSFTSDFDF